VTYDYGDPEDSEWLGTLAAATEAALMLRDAGVVAAIAERMRPCCGRRR